ncbi:MAG: hypothetical protein PHX86_06290 [Caldisericia bacterium]|nr:hypothetical protein [Caldisericia bacterium]
MIRKSLCFLCIATILFMPFSSNVTAVDHTSPSFYTLYWLVPSSMKVSRLYEEFTFQEQKQLEVAARSLNPQQGDYSHSVFSPCGGAIHLHPVESIKNMYKFYPTLRCTSYYRESNGEIKKSLVFLTSVKNQEGDWLFFHFDVYKTLSLKALLLNSDATVQWKHISVARVEKSIDGFMKMYQTVWDMFEEKQWSEAQELVSICFSGKLWEDILFSCKTMDENANPSREPLSDFVKANSPKELLDWYAKDFEKTRVRDYRFQTEDRDALANFLNHTREKNDFSFTCFNVVAYTDDCYHLEDESHRRILYVGEVTYCPIPECFRNCCLKALKDANKEWSFSYTTNTMIKNEVFLKTYGVSPLIADCEQEERLYLEYLNALGLLLINDEKPSLSEQITLLFSLRAKDSCPKKY